MSGDRATAGACIPLRRPDRSFAGFQEREVAAARFFMSRCSLSEADAVEAVKLARGDGAALRLPDQRISFVRVSQYWGGELDWAGPLEPKKLYRLFFSPEALEHAAAASGHGLKLLDCHPREDVDVATDDELRKYCVGEVEDDLRFDGRPLRASTSLETRCTARSSRDRGRRRRPSMRPPPRFR